MKFIPTALSIGALLMATPSFATVFINDICQTNDLKYTVMISTDVYSNLDHQNHLYALLLNASQDKIGLWEVKRSIAADFSHGTLVDLASEGQGFTFAYPSLTNSWGFDAVPETGAPIHYNQNDLTCIPFAL